MTSRTYVSTESEFFGTCWRNIALMTDIPRRWVTNQFDNLFLHFLVKIVASQRLLISAGCIFNQPLVLFTYLLQLHQQRIASLYLPFLSIMLGNVSRLTRDGQPPLGPSLSIADEGELDRNRLGSDRGHERSNSIGRKSASLQRDSNVLDIIAGRGKIQNIDPPQWVTGSSRVIDIHQ